MHDYRSLILGASLAIVASVAAPVGARAQIRNPGDLDPSGRVLAKVGVGMIDAIGGNHPASGLNVVIIAVSGVRTSVRTDDSGIAAAWLEPGSYRFLTSEPLTWQGKAYTWDLTTTIQPGTGILRLSQFNAQNKPASPDSVGPAPVIPARDRPSAKLRLFADCQAEGCDLDYFRTEIPFVDYMRDRADASVHLLITSQPTGGGGTTYTINFIGLREMAGAADTLYFRAPQSATSDDKRRGLARVIKLGLVRYVLRTPAGDQLQVGYAPRSASVSTATGAAYDPWNLWVFQTNVGGDVSGEKSQHFTSLRGSSLANRTSEAWKFRIGVTGGYKEGKFTFSDGSKFATYSHYYGARHVLVKSLGAHFSAGEKASLTSSTFLNQKLFLRFAPAIEYDIFPYAEATRRQLTFQYSVGVNSFRYQDTTIFDKISEVRPDQSLTAALDVKQPWGSVGLSIEGAALLDDFSKQRMVLNGSFDVRVFKGFSINVYGIGSLLRDQLYLAKGTLSDEDILVRRRQLASRFNYYAGIGISYTFGSIFSNIVNPRFELAGGN